MKSALALAAFAVAALAATSAAAQEKQEWTGFYVGGSVGYAMPAGSNSESVLFDRDLNGTFNDTVTTSTGANAFSPGFCGGRATSSAPGTGCRGDDEGVSLAVHAGYDYQFAGTPMVLGIVADVGGSFTTDSVTAFSTTPAFYTLTRSVDWEGSIRARIGYAVAPKVLAYVTGGPAYGQVSNSFRTSNTANRFTNNGNEDAWGFKAGVGIEYKVFNHITVGGQYLFSALYADGYRVRASNTGTTPATNPFLLGNTGGTDFMRSKDDFSEHKLMVTANYRF